jgi:hypothetical protein
MGLSNVSANGDVVQAVSPARHGYFGPQCATKFVRMDVRDSAALRARVRD